MKQRAKEIIRLTIHSDPAHGWLECPKSLAIRLGILSRISRFSHQLGCLIFLESDNDAELAIEALKERGIPYEVQPIYYPDYCNISQFRPFET